MQARLVLAGFIMGAGLAGVTPAVASTGGIAAPGTPKVDAVRCVSDPLSCPAQAVTRGARVQVSGRDLQIARAVVFRGARGSRDDVSAPARNVTATGFEVVVPRRARTGRVDLVAKHTKPRTVARRLKVVAPPSTASTAELPAGTFFAGAAAKPTLDLPDAGLDVQVVSEADGRVVRRWTTTAPGPAAWDGRDDAGAVVPNGRYRMTAGSANLSFGFYDHVFPIRGPHDLGQSATNNFGGERDHKGQDMFAKCGVPLAAAREGVVRFADSDGRAGHYLVIRSEATGLDYIYMHMQAPPTLKKGDSVTTGQVIGAVGDSGNASGCHLHFELWEAPGWYSGGGAVDPLPRLSAWDSWS